MKIRTFGMLEMSKCESWSETWRVQQAVNLMVLDMVEECNLTDTYAKRARDIFKIFSHMHQTRLMWLEADESLPEGVNRVEKGASSKIPAIRQALVASSEAVLAWMHKVERTGKVPGFKKSPDLFFAYLVAHEAHHRGHILAALRSCGHAPDSKDIYALWDWDKI